MQIENINFTPKALKLIKYADDIAKKNNFYEKACSAKIVPMPSEGQMR